MASPIAELLVAVGFDGDGAVKGLAGLSSNLDSFSVNAKNALPASVALAGGGAGIAAGFAEGVRSAGDLQQAVANISTIKPEIDSSAVFTALNDMTTRVPQSAAQLGDALYDIFSSIEITQTDALTLVEKFAKGAIGAQTDAKTFGTSVIGVMNAYGLSVADADHISDVFFNTIKNGVVTGPELAASLGPVTQSAKNAGISLDVLGGLIAGVTKEGGPAAQNINNLNNLLAKLLSPDAAKGFAQLGVSLTNADGTFRPFLDVLTDTKAALDGLTPAARSAAIAATFPDLQARTGLTTLISQLDFVKKAVADNTGTAGAAASAYTTMAGTFNSQTQLMANSFTALLTTIGVQLIPAIQAVTGFVNGLVSGFAALPEPVKTGIAAFIGIAGLLAGIIGVAGIAAFTIVSLAGSFSALGLMLGITGAGLLALLGPIALIVGTVALLGVAWANNWGGIQQITAGAISAIGSVLSGLQPLLQGAADFFTNTLLPALGAAGQFIQANVLPFIIALADLGFARLQAAVTQLVAFWNSAFLPALQATGDFFNQFVLPPFQALGTLIQNVIGPVLQGLGTVLGPLGVELGKIFGGVGANAATNLQTATADIQAQAAATRAQAGVQNTMTINGPVVNVENIANEVNADGLVDRVTDIFVGAESRATPPMPAGAGVAF